jgi:hypothetical protein
VDLLGNALGKVFLELGDLLIKGEFFEAWLRGKGEVVATLAAELETGRIAEATLGAGYLQLFPTFTAELHSIRILKSAFGTLHEVPPRDGCATGKVSLGLAGAPPNRTRPSLLGDGRAHSEGFLHLKSSFGGLEG